MTKLWQKNYRTLADNDKKKMTQQWQNMMEPWQNDKRLMNELGEGQQNNDRAMTEWWQNNDDDRAETKQWKNWVRRMTEL